MIRDSMVFYRSFAEGIEDLSEEDQLKAFWNLVKYGLDGIEPDDKGPARAVFKMAKPQIDANNSRYQNGTKGGRKGTKLEPSENQTETKVEPNVNQIETKPEPNPNQVETKPEPNENENVNDNDLLNKSAKADYECEKPDSLSTDFATIRELYNSVCGSYPRLVKLSEARKKAIRARIRSGYTVDDFKRLFEEAENSAFLKGANSRNWSATFDWLIADSNMAKVLEGKYRSNHNRAENGGNNGDVNYGYRESDI